MVIHANLERRGRFESSDEVLNKIDEHCITAQLANLQSVPTDCPQRDERLGWMGDAGLTSDSFCINFDVRSFLSNYLVLIKDEQIAVEGSKNLTILGSVPSSLLFFLVFSRTQPILFFWSYFKMWCLIIVLAQGRAIRVGV